MHALLTDIRQFCDTIGFRGRVVLGGSAALGEATEHSDIDCYLIPKTIRGFLQLRKKKAAFEAFRQARGLRIEYIIFPECLLRFGVYFVRGVDDTGARFDPPYDTRVLCANSLKMAYRSLLWGVFGDAQRSAYHVRKAILYGVYSRALLRHDPQILKPPLFSAAHLALVHSIPAHAKQILEWKQTDGGHVTNADIAYVGQYLEETFRLWQNERHSWKQYLLYNFFALRYGSGRFLLCHPDSVVLQGFYDAFMMSDREGFHAWEPHTFKVFVV